jgi:SAM-dependent methyltransferase
MRIRGIYRAIVPTSVRDSPWVSALKGRLLGHDWTYSDDYYRNDVEGPAVRSAGAIAATIVREFHPHSVVDVGCGTGALLAALRDRGCQVFGLEYSRAALRYCQRRQLDVERFDIERGAFKRGRSFDVVSSMEVAEHLPASVADRYVDILTSLASVAVFTAAPPGQGGADHVNEQLPAYWIEKFRARGFEHLGDTSQKWREEWRSGGMVQAWYYDNLMLFQRRANRH